MRQPVQEGIDSTDRSCLLCFCLETFSLILTAMVACIWMIPRIEVTFELDT